MQWVHSLKGLVGHLIQWSESKVKDIEAQLIQMEKDKLERQANLQRQALESRFGEGRRVNFNRGSGVGGGPSGMKKISKSVYKMFKGDNNEGEGITKEQEDELSLSTTSAMVLASNAQRFVRTPLKRQDSSGTSLMSPRGTSIGADRSERRRSTTVGFEDEEDQEDVNPAESLRARAAMSRWRRRHRNALQLPPVLDTTTDADVPRTPSSAPRRLSTAAVTFANLDNLTTLTRPKSFRALVTKRTFSYGLKSTTLRAFGTPGILGPARKSFLQEVGRSHRCVLNPGGTLRVRPIQVLNIGERAKPLYLAVRYGLQLQRTAKAKAGAYPRWDKATNANEIILNIEPLETTGNVHLSIWSEHELHDVELGRLEVPLGCILDCCGDMGEYTKWFPLVRPQPIPEEGGDDGRSLFPMKSEADRSESFTNEPCVKLTFNWKSKEKLPGSRTTSYLRAYLREISVALIDSYQPMELISLSVRNIEARYVDSPFLTRASLVVSWLQLDNQLPSTDAPVILGPTPVQLPQPLLQCSVFRNKQKNQQRSTENFVSLQYIFVLLQELDLKIEESLVLALWRFASRILLNTLQEAGTGTEAGLDGGHVYYDEVDEIFAGVNSPTRSSPPPPSKSQSKALDYDTIREEEEVYGLSTKMVYIEQLELCPIKVNISFFKSTMEKRLWKSSLNNSSSLLLQQEEDQEGLMLASSAGIRKNIGIAAAFNSFQLITDMILPLIPSISDASIKLNALNITHVFQTREQITATLQAHYTSNFLFQLYRIIGSVDLIGNPLSFVSSLGTGVIDFFYEPAQGLIKVCYALDDLRLSSR